MKIGYHYTSLKCWKNIQKTGLVPYIISKPYLQYYNGIWIWTLRFHGLEHIGSVLYQMAHKNTTKAVLLSVKYLESHVLTVEEGIVVLHHSGHIENLEYHNGEQDAIIYLDTIHPEQITLIEEYDLLDIWTS